MVPAVVCLSWGVGDCLLGCLGDPGVSPPPQGLIISVNQIHLNTRFGYQSNCCHCASQEVLLSNLATCKQFEFIGGVPHLSSFPGIELQFEFDS